MLSQKEIDLIMVVIDNSFTMDDAKMLLQIKYPNIFIKLMEGDLDRIYGLYLESKL